MLSLAANRARNNAALKLLMAIAPWRAYLAVLDRDAISSQLIDNLNASIHLRALLTDLFLIGEVLRAIR
jgi:hypothetical protein